MRIEDLLDLAGEELLAAAVDHLLEAAHDLHVAGRVELSEIPGAEPAVGGEELGVRGGVLVIAEVDRRAQGRDLALGPRWDVAAGVVDDADPETGGDGAHRAGDRLRVVGEPRVGVEAGLQHSVQLDQVAVHPRPELANGLDRARGAPGDDHAERGQIELAEVRMVQHGDDRRGRGRDVGDALAPDQVERGGGTELIEQDHTRAGHDRLHERQVPPVEPERQVDQEHVVLGDAHVGVQRPAGRERRVVAVDHTLGIAGRARREGHPHHVVRALAGAGRRDGARVLHERVERHAPRAGDAAQHTDRLEVGQPGPQLADHLHVVEALEARRADEGAALREAQDVVDLAAPEVGSDLVRHRAQALQGEEHVCELGPVRELDRDHVAPPDVEGAEPGCDAVDASPELSVRDLAPAVDDRHAIGMGRGAAGEDRVERLGAPVSGLLVPLDELVAEPCLEAHADQPPRYAALTCGLSRSIAAEPLSTIRPVSMT